MLKLYKIKLSQPVGKSSAYYTAQPNEAKAIEWIIKIAKMNEFDEHQLPWVIESITQKPLKDMLMFSYDKLIYAQEILEEIVAREIGCNNVNTAFSGYNYEDLLETAIELLKQVKEDKE